MSTPIRRGIILVMILAATRSDNSSVIRKVSACDIGQVMVVGRQPYACAKNVKWSLMEITK